MSFKKDGYGGSSYEESNQILLVYDSETASKDIMKCRKVSVKKLPSMRMIAKNRIDDMVMDNAQAKMIKGNGQL